jgi:hypothetical protein
LQRAFNSQLLIKSSKEHKGNALAVKLKDQPAAICQPSSECVRDALPWKQRYTPRRARSQWSKLNLEEAQSYRRQEDEVGRRWPTF